MLVSTGNGKDYVQQNNTEILNLDSEEAQVPTYHNHSQCMEGATGGFVANKFITCGGASDGDVLNQCYEVGKTGTSNHGLMKQKRHEAASIVMKDRLWILGGKDVDFNVFKSTEYISHDGSQEDGPDLPIALHAHAAIKINETNFMLVGGYDEHYNSRDNTWVYSNGNWTDGPALKKARNYHSVGKIRDSVTHKDYIVVTGGTENIFYFKDTEILEIDGTEWEAGKHL